MSTEKRELYNIIDTLSEELSNKVIDYIEYLKYANTLNTAPSDLLIKSKEDLIQKLEEGMKDTDSGNVCSLEQVFKEVNGILQN
ncbi:MAG: hypothetical protein RSE41_10130 [Clostridia bacterium]